MIKAVFHHSNQTVKKIIVTGHAGHGHHGSDIVCAAVSASVLMTANAITSLHLDPMVSVEVGEGRLILDVIQSGPILEGLLLTLENAIIQMQIDYPKHITIRKEE